MTCDTLLELAEKWENDAKPPEIEDGSEAAKESNEILRSKREALRKCANDLRTLVNILG